MRKLTEEQREASRKRSKKWRDKQGKEKLSAYFKEDYINNIDKRRASRRKYSENNREEAKKRSLNHWHSKSKEERSRISNERRLKQRFKRTPEWYNETLAQQGGHCALCTAVENKKRLHVDHDHKCCKGRITCGKCIRGLLCDACNTTLGYLERFLGQCSTYPESNSDKWLGRAMDYLAKWSNIHNYPQEAQHV